MLSFHILKVTVKFSFDIEYFRKQANQYTLVTYFTHSDLEVGFQI